MIHHCSNGGMLYSLSRVLQEQELLSFNWVSLKNGNCATQIAFHMDFVGVFVTLNFHNSLGGLAAEHKQRYQWLQFVIGEFPHLQVP